MRWVSLLLLVVLVPVASAELAPSLSPASGVHGTEVSVSISYTPSVKMEYTLWRSPDDVDLVSGWCSENELCDISHTQTIPVGVSEVGYYYQFVNASELVVVDSKTVNFTLTSSSPPVFTSKQWPFDADLSISNELTFVFGIEDDVAVREVNISFDDSSGSTPATVKTAACSASPCSVTFTHTYEEIGLYEVVVEAVDDEGLVGRIDTVLEIGSELDLDRDGVLDTEDVCKDSDSAASDNVATSGEWVGCSCLDVEKDDLGADDDVCTQVSCSLVDGALTITNEPIPDGGQPEGRSDSPSVDYSCVDGELVTTYLASCEPEVQTACWDGDVYHYDSCGNRGDKAESCSSSEVCTGDPAGAFCESGVACTASPGCRFNQPSNAVSVNAVCDSGETCWACDEGFSYRDGSCRPSLSCATFYQNDDDGDGQGAGPASCDSGQFLQITWTPTPNDTKGIAGDQSRRRVRALVMNWRRGAF